ncbi:FAD-dependent oxidoreductase [Streptomyces erythrochromogenes]|uniref:FAD-dependent oxidoreductase n=1 Tax=Streptomyces erythrochromogenes TaxID=285574 RepID=UPI00382A07B6
MTDLATDVLVVGGGPAAAWAALAAARAGARVVLADKGYCGTSGATAAGGTGVRYVPPDEPAVRDIGRGEGRTPGALRAVGPPLDPAAPPITS